MPATSFGAGKSSRLTAGEVGSITSSTITRYGQVLLSSRWFTATDAPLPDFTSTDNTLRNTLDRYGARSLSSSASVMKWPRPSLRRSSNSCIRGDSCCPVTFTVSSTLRSFVSKIAVRRVSPATTSTAIAAAP